MKKNSIRNSFSNLNIFNITIVIVLIAIVYWIRMQTKISMQTKENPSAPIVLNNYTVEFFNDGNKIPDDNNKYYCVVELLPNVMKEDEKKSKAYTWHFLAHSQQEFKEMKFKFKNSKWQQQFSFEDTSLGFGGDHTYTYDKNTTTMTIKNVRNLMGKTTRKSVDLYINDDDNMPGCSPNQYNDTIGCA